jgi:hypothetical protein
MTGIAGCCARATSGQATAAPPRAAINSRRPMVTVIRPSRARCVNRSYCSSAQEKWLITFRPSTYPVSLRPRRNSTKRQTSDCWDPLLRKPITGMVGCCARAASGHAAAPPTAASNSRRPMVTVMRPSRARVRKCNDTTPRARCPNCVAPGAGGAAGSPSTCALLSDEKTFD